MRNYSVEYKTAQTRIISRFHAHLEKKFSIMMKNEKREKFNNLCKIYNKIEYDKNGVKKCLTVQKKQFNKCLF